MTQTLYFAPDALISYASGVFQNVGLPVEDADIVAADLVRSNLRGIDSHGISRIPMYLERLQRGLVNPRPNIVVRRVAGAVAEVDGDNGMGFLASHKAMNEAIELAKASGIGLVGVRRSTISAWARSMRCRPSRLASSR